jgi:hypothetical protein
VPDLDQRSSGWAATSSNGLRVGREKSTVEWTGVVRRRSAEGEKGQITKRQKEPDRRARRSHKSEDFAMKVFAIALGIAGTVAAGSAGAQALPRSGATVYQPTQSVCSYRRSTNSVGDVIFGRTNTASNCQDVYSRDDGAWYQVGRGRNNNSIYERRVTDSRGNLIIQRARRNPNGTFTILSTRTANASDKQWKRVQKAQEKAYKQQQKEQERAYKKQQKEQDKELRREDKYDRGHR